jgi:two-component system cell cycle sensor histidine kinase/response regulator CckA
MSYVATILIVDDDPRMCDSLKVLLGRDGYQIHTTHNGQEALEALAKNDFDLVLLDLVLPDIVGAEIMDHIDAQAPETCVIVMTGYTSLDSAIESLKKGAFDYVRKPFEHEELARAVKNALDQKALRNERKQAEEAWRESEEKYKRLVESSLTGIFIHRDGKYVFINDRFAEIHGYAREELLGEEYLTLIHPDEREAFAQIASARLKGEAVPQRYQVRRLRKDGKTIWCEMMATRIEYGVRPAIMGNIIDISERKRAEEALRESEEKYRELVENANSIILRRDAQGNITFFNEFAQSFFGYSRDEILGKNVIGAIVPETDSAGRDLAAMIRDIGLQPERYANNENENMRRNGERVWVSWTNKAVRDKDGNIVEILCVGNDITERKRLQRQLRQAHKMEAIGTLAGGIAHDFNNLLTGILGNVSLMLMDIDSSHPHYPRLKNIQKQVQSGAKLTSHMLGYARKGKYEVKPIDLNGLVKQTSEVFRRTRKEIAIHRELAEDLFAIEADQGQIEQVLLNLFVNSADAMPGGGDLTLKTTNTIHKDIKGELYDPRPGNYVQLTVTDNGTGMDKKSQERIFDPFFTTKEMGRGTGLGLASAYGIIKAHGGYIDVESKKGHGTTFHIYLPASDKEVRKATKRPVEIFRAPGTVLLVDDEQVILEVGQDLLEAMGYRIITAKDGKEAVEVYRKNREEIDIVVLDMVMPNMGGGEAYDHIKEINPDVRVLLSSGFSIDGEAAEILERGCDGFIQKPFTMKQLSKEIRQILDKK